MQPIARITTTIVVAGRERRLKTPHQARHFLDALRGIFQWAVEAKLVKSDPTAGVKNPPRKKGPGFKMWTEEDMAAYERRWPIGTRQRVWLDVLAYTGLRRGDAVRLGRAHVRDGVVTIKTEKSGFMVAVTLPILPALAATLAASPCGDLTFISGESGRPLTKNPLATNSAKHAALLACAVRHTACARSRLRGRPRTARPSPSSRRSSAGMVAAWPRTTRAKLIACGSLRWRCTSLRTRSEHLFPYLWVRCGQQGEKNNEIKAEFFRWWARETCQIRAITTASKV